MLKLALRIPAGLLLAVLLLIALGGAMAAVSSNAPRGRMVDIGGRSLHLVCVGPKSDHPTVWFESGAFGIAADWAEVQRRLADKGQRSCAYDRAGLGSSDPGPAPRDSRAIAADLEKLIARSGEEGPFIFVGHSMAGLHVRLYAVTHPAQVAGIVLVDATTAEASDNATLRMFVERFGQISRLASSAASIGLLKPLAPLLGDGIGLPPDAVRAKQAAFGSGPSNRAAADEVTLWLTDAAQAREAGNYDPTWPVAVVTAGPVGNRAAWKSAQAAPARASRYPYAVNVDQAGHASLLGRRFGQAIVDAILHVRDAAG
ncbi:pimeloyl-ACP methyl ester carboxylesterase [Caulobacter ginsengisoli]|uniref:Pimeloyl-ACP methyl ester carboxylesterase n=1 Tax=Caulobacter ginsengisoli TaxID=400775 RepID=A0ABU0IUL8_9CAUL|nr:alpha/beta fold hydrolase [Caulobacter ginsengisoli]MDQ0465075.1 pimeloyl-ACP methyl ester carboxylesterase [Caulobacter ginsengisoli]